MTRMKMMTGGVFEIVVSMAWPADSARTGGVKRTFVFRGEQVDFEIVVFSQGDENFGEDDTGGTDVDTGATNRKLGSDMADSVTGGGLHGKDLSKADVSVNIYAWLKAQNEGRPVELSCAIGDETVDGRPYSEIVRIARDYVKACGGFERFAEWGLV